MKNELLIIFMTLVPIIIIIGLYCKMIFETLKDKDYFCFFGAVSLLWVFVIGLLIFILNI